MKETLYRIEQMDCPSEEQMIRLKLQGITTIKAMEFDLSRREFRVFHDGNSDEISNALSQLNLGSSLISSEAGQTRAPEEDSQQRKLLWVVLIINLSFFFIEIVFGFISGSMGLVADSLDMMADTLVYGLSLYAVGSTLLRKKRVATLAGILQISLALLGFSEVVRRILLDERFPDATTMIMISLLALVANAFCLVILQKSSSKEEARIKASLIFTSNDIIINLGVILAGIMVLWFNSNLPDLIIGSLVFLLVIRGGTRILKLGR